VKILFCERIIFDPFILGRAPHGRPVIFPASTASSTSADRMNQPGKITPELAVQTWRREILHRMDIAKMPHAITTLVE
jgi:hypothetical protein